jgi:prophage antirepressor-like protein
MSNITLFEFAHNKIRTTVDEKGEVWFVGKDVAKVLGYANCNDALIRHCKGVVKRDPLSTPGGKQVVSFIAEPDVFRLITHSKLPEAEQFERWVFEEVLPAIRRKGAYTPNPTLPDNDLIETILMLGGEVAGVPGVQPAILMASILACIQDNTCLNLDALRAALPGSVGYPPSVKNPPKLGDVFTH